LAPLAMPICTRAAIHLIGRVVSLRSRAAVARWRSLWTSFCPTGVHENVMFLQEAVRPGERAGSFCLVEQVPTIDTFGCARFHLFGNGEPQKRAGPATRERRKPWRRQAPPFPESVIHRGKGSAIRATIKQKKTLPPDFIKPVLPAT
jgi:hypothetical protein